MYRNTDTDRLVLRDKVESEESEEHLEMCGKGGISTAPRISPIR